jgi:transcriptional regulator with PAS, ATPase and Fis domain
VKEGRFRRDLYYRLASITMEIPPLRERQNDIEKLAVHFASELDKSLSERAIFRLKAHSWPGNVRELRHAIERASGLASPFESVLSEKSFDFLLTRKNINQEPTLDHGDAIFSLEEMERIMLLKALKLTEGNRSKASSILGIARSTLFEMMRRHKIQGPKSVFTA